MDIILNKKAPTLMAAAAFGYMTASAAQSWWYNWSDDVPSDKKSIKAQEYINTGVGVIGAVISSKAAYDMFLATPKF